MKYIIALVLVLCLLGSACADIIDELDNAQKEYHRILDKFKTTIPVGDLVGDREYTIRITENYFNNSAWEIEIRQGSDYTIESIFIPIDKWGEIKTVVDDLIEYPLKCPICGSEKVYPKYEKEELCD